MTVIDEDFIGSLHQRIDSLFERSANLVPEAMHHLFVTMAGLMTLTPDDPDAGAALVHSAMMRAHCRLMDRLTAPYAVEAVLTMRSAEAAMTSALFQGLEPSRSLIGTLVLGSYADFWRFVSLCTYEDLLRHGTDALPPLEESCMQMPWEDGDEIEGTDEDGDDAWPG